MKYLVTGATGFIGRFLIERLLERRNATVYVLMRRTSADRFAALQQRMNVSEERLAPVWGDITREGVIDDAARAHLAGQIDHVFHLAAVYDMDMSDAQADRVNNQGTAHIVALANTLANESGRKPCFHHVSSVAVAGADYEGVFSDRMFDEGQTVTHPYYRTKFQSEAVVREQAAVPWRIYRPGMVVGHSETGAMDKVDGPYYFFRTIKRVRDHVPKWLPLLGIEGGQMPVAPVDYVVDAMVHIAHKRNQDNRAFFLIQDDPPTAGEMLRIFLRAAHGPDIVRNLPTHEWPASIEHQVKRLASRLPMAGWLERRVSKALGVPLSILGYVNNRAVFDDVNTRAALAGSGIHCPRLEDYAETLWRYWELHMDCDIDVPEELTRRIRGKVVVITGASSGIGFMTSKKLARAGAKVCMVARTPSKLEETRAIVERIGGEAYAYPCDLNKMEAIDACTKQILADHHHVDILINNAGHSIRRSVFESLNRFHDYERTMQLNYFGAIRMIFNFLPSMAKRRSGHIINISSIGCLTNVPRFSAYVASKSALDAFSRCLSPEVGSRNIDLTTIYMPLVRTPMIAPTKLYDYVPTLTPEQAGDMVVSAVLEKPKRIASPLGTTAQVSYALWPKVNDFVLHKAFHMFPSSKASRGYAARREADEKPNIPGRVLAALLPGPYW
ncbi:short-chain dehydrogenase [Salinisphaera orenii MK-B5]|uniref:Short-chain dehydrogenase n=1 Tax=Salinisphaera orenii MK-B5 TaxID=856730 RepID=A0A423PVS6_9GAMM|nr:SDR family oxidoreductase [Salinisphaera orenii]ROO29679.1 short-chain dehydrogenase [Salinisphaera orenii MK-B5]